ESLSAFCPTFGSGFCSLYRKAKPRTIVFDEVTAQESEQEPSLSGLSQGAGSWVLRWGMRSNIHSRALPVASPSKAPKEMIATTVIIQLIPSLSRQKTNADERTNTATSRIVKTNLTCIPRMHHGWQIHP